MIYIFFYHSIVYDSLLGFFFLNFHNRAIMLARPGIMGPTRRIKLLGRAETAR